MCKEKVDCATCFWFNDDAIDIWCGYYNQRIEEYEPCDKYVEAKEFCADHDIYIGKGGKVRVVPNKGEDDYFNRRIK